MFCATAKGGDRFGGPIHYLQRGRGGGGGGGGAAVRTPGSAPSYLDWAPSGTRPANEMTLGST